MAKKVRVVIDDVEEKEEKTIKKLNNKVIIGVIVGIVVLLVSGLIVWFIFSRGAKVLDDITTDEPKENNVETHYITCSNNFTKTKVLSRELKYEYQNNELVKYTYSVFVDEGKELSEEDAWSYVDYYENQMPWEVDEKGYSRDDYNNPYKYRIYYTLTAEHYCSELGGCTDTESKYDHRDDLIPELEKQLSVVCTAN